MTNTFFSCFCTLETLVINGSTSPIGELTNRTISYAKDPDFYKDQNKPATLVLFRGVKGNSQREKIPSTHKDGVLEVCNWLYTKAVEGKITTSSQNCLQQLKTEFGKDFNFSKVNTMVTNGAIWLPSYIQFTLTKNNIEHEFNIWFANEYFETEYPYKDIYVIGPVPPEEIDILIKYNYKDLRQRLYEETIDRIEDRVHKLIGGDKYPYTTRMVISYDVYDLKNKGEKTKANWTIIIYGNPKDSDEAIEEAIKDCINKNTKGDEEDWENAIPDLWNPLELFVIPHFNKLGMINEKPMGSTYSPIYRTSLDDNLAKKYFDFFDQSFVLNNLEIVPHLYKSILMSTIGKPKNNLERTRFSLLYPDYQLIPSADSQSGMMSKETSEFILRMEEVLAASETTTPNTPSTGKIQKVVRKDRLHVSLKIGKVKVLTLTKYQLEKDNMLV